MSIFLGFPETSSDSRWTCGSRGERRDRQEKVILGIPDLLLICLGLCAGFWFGVGGESILQDLLLGEFRARA
jgi:hypothetical protein